MSPFTTVYPWCLHLERQHVLSLGFRVYTQSVTQQHDISLGRHMLHQVQSQLNDLTLLLVAHLSVLTVCCTLHAA